MCRRFRRIRRLAHQVVEVTRRLWRVCGCCGTVNIETQRDIVPVRTVINGTVTKRSPGNSQDVQFGLCCLLQHRRYLVQQTDGTQSCPSMHGYITYQDTGLKMHKELLPKTEDAIQGMAAEREQSLHSAEEGQSLHGSDQDSGRTNSLLSIPCQQPSDTSQTDDFVPMLYYRRLSPTPVINTPFEAEGVFSGSSSTHFPPLNPSRENSTTSQTDDDVPMLYYKQAPSTPVTNMPTETEDVAFGSSSTYSLPVSPSRENNTTSQTDDEVPMLYYKQAPSTPVTNMPFEAADVECGSSSTYSLPVSPSRENNTTSQTDNDVPMLYYKQASSTPVTNMPFEAEHIVCGPSATHFLPVCPSRENSTTSQTDDNVPMLYYKPASSTPLTNMPFKAADVECGPSSTRSLPVNPFRENSATSQTDDDVPMLYYKQASPTSVTNMPSEAEHIVCGSSSTHVFPVRPSRENSTTSQTDDDVPMLYYRHISPTLVSDMPFEAEGIVCGSSSACSLPVSPSRKSSNNCQTDDGVPMRFYYQVSSSCSISTSLENVEVPASAPYKQSSETSQTDDFVPMRFYSGFSPPTSILPFKESAKSLSGSMLHEQSSSTSQTDDIVPMRYYRSISPSVAGSFTSPDTGDVVLTQQSSDTSQTDDHVVMRFYRPLSPEIVQIPRGILIHGDRQPTSTTGSNRTVHFETDIKKTFYSRIRSYEHLDVPQEPDTFTESGISCQLREFPKNLTLEFAKDPIWSFICPSELPVEETLYQSTISTINLVTVGDNHKELVLKIMRKADSELESSILMECHSARTAYPLAPERHLSGVVQLCASFVQGDMRYLCMSYYERRDLAVWLDKDKMRYYIREKDAKWIVAYVVAGLQYLHSRNILHLDIKPSNILIDGKGFPLLSDFGKARRRRFEQPLEDPDRLDDIWGVACLMYETITRAPPFPHGDFSVLPDISRLSIYVQEFIGYHLGKPRDIRMMMNHRCDSVMRHDVFENIKWNEVKYSRKCRLNSLFERIYKDEWMAEHTPDLAPTNPFLRIRDSGRPSTSSDVKESSPRAELPTPLAESPAPSAEVSKALNPASTGLAEATALSVQTPTSPPKVRNLLNIPAAWPGIPTTSSKVINLMDIPGTSTQKPRSPAEVPALLKATRRSAKPPTSKSEAPKLPKAPRPSAKPPASKAETPKLQKAPTKSAKPPASKTEAPKLQNAPTTSAKPPTSRAEAPKLHKAPTKIKNLLDIATTSAEPPTPLHKVRNFLDIATLAEPPTPLHKVRNFMDIATTWAEPPPSPPRVRNLLDIATTSAELPPAMPKIGNLMNTATTSAKPQLSPHKVRNLKNIATTSAKPPRSKDEAPKLQNSLTPSTKPPALKAEAPKLLEAPTTSTKPPASKTEAPKLLEAPIMSAKPPASKAEAPKSLEAPKTSAKPPASKAEAPKSLEAPKTSAKPPASKAEAPKSLEAPKTSAEPPASKAEAPKSLEAPKTSAEPLALKAEAPKSLEAPKTSAELSGSVTKTSTPLLRPSSAVAEIPTPSAETPPEIPGGVSGGGRRCD